MAFDRYLTLWQLTPDGDPIATRSSRLLPVRCSDGAAAMLKIAIEEEERQGAALMLWWEGDGAARVLAQAGDALLLERALGRSSLAEMARNGRDDEASRIISAVAARLDAQRPHPVPPLMPLALWFRELQPAAARHGGILLRAATTARELLAAPQDTAVLHGDLHHGNILDFGPRGWLAIDPKGLLGERGFDFANIFYNPDLAVATAPGRLTRQAAILAEAAGLDRNRLLKWILAYAGLSAAWTLGEGEQPDIALAVARSAAAVLAQT
jgi:streptomycin 6-kinase